MGKGICVYADYGCIAVIRICTVPDSQCSKKDIPKTSEMNKQNFVLIKGGTFQMGSPDTENWRTKDEKCHTVTVSDFYMGVYEVTQAEYKKVMKKNPSRFSGKNLPVETVSWLDAVSKAKKDPTGPKSGNYRVYRGGGWNDLLRIWGLPRLCLECW